MFSMPYLISSSDNKITSLGRLPGAFLHRALFPCLDWHNISSVAIMDHDEQAMKITMPQIARLQWHKCVSNPSALAWVNPVCRNISVNRTLSHAVSNAGHFVRKKPPFAPKIDPVPCPRAGSVCLCERQSCTFLPSVLILNSHTGRGRVGADRSNPDK